MTDTRSLDEQITDLRHELERLEAHAAADDAALADADAALAREQAVYDAAAANLATAQAATVGSPMYERQRDPNAERAYSEAQAAFQAAKDDLAPLLIARTEASRRRSERRGQVRHIQQRIEQLEAERTRLAAAAARPQPGRALLATIRQRVTASLGLSGQADADTAQPPAVSMSTAAPAPLEVSLEEAARRLGTTSEAVRKRAARGQVPSRHDGRRLLITLPADTTAENTEIDTYGLTPAPLSGQASGGGSPPAA